MHIIMLFMFFKGRHESNCLQIADGDFLSACPDFAYCVVTGLTVSLPQSMKESGEERKFYSPLQSHELMIRLKLGARSCFISACEMSRAGTKQGYQVQRFELMTFRLLGDPNHTPHPPKKTPTYIQLYA